MNSVCMDFWYVFCVFLLPCNFSLCSWEFKLVSVKSLVSVQSIYFVYFQTPEGAKNIGDKAFLESSCLKREM